jgi:hypothetical protein
MASISGVSLSQTFFQSLPLHFGAVDWNLISKLLPTTTVIFFFFFALVFFGCFVILFGKSRRLGAAVSSNNSLINELRTSAHPLAMFHQGVLFASAPLAELYIAASKELSFQLIGTDQVDKDFLTRLRGSGRIWSSQLTPIRGALEQAKLSAIQPFESKLGTVNVVLRTIPWLACLAPLLTWFETKSGPSATQSLVLAISLSPVVLALLGTVFCQFLSGTVSLGIRRQNAVMKQFSLELMNIIDRAYVCHRNPLERLPSIDGFGQPDGPNFSLPPSEATSHGAPRTPLN